MKVRDLQWDPRTLEHAGRHGIDLMDLLALREDARALLRRARMGRYLLIGRGRGGRIVTVVVRKRGVVFHLVTARPSTDSEASLYRESE